MKQPIFLDGEHDYDLLIENSKYSLFYSGGSQWSDDTKNELALSILDDGNGLEISKPYNKKSLNYMQASQLYIILRYLEMEQKSTYEIGILKSL